MRQPVLLILCFSVFTSLKAQNPYDLGRIPDSIKEKASVITHLENINLEVENPDRAVVTIKKVFTVMNEDGKSALFFSEYTSKYFILDNVEIKVYDKNGRQVNKFKKKDLTTVAYGEGLIDDGYMTYLSISAPSYPVTVEYNYQQILKSTLNLPDYRFINPMEAVIESSYTAKIPAGINLRYKARHTSIQPVITDEGKYKLYQWKVSNLQPVKTEAGSVAARSRFPHVSIVAEQFSHYGYKGDFSSWKSFGGWINELCNGLEELPETKQQFFKNLVKDAPDDREKIRLLYNYLQENFRYVSIQLGIGGYRPFSPKFTDDKKYGDCKALSYYMKSALQSVGIRSHVAIINSQYNQEPVDRDFPSNDFNHMILCVPGKKDSVWLECTSMTAEFAQLGSFTENRNALLITETGGVLVPTPKSEAGANTFVSNTRIRIENDLSALAETSIYSTGEFREILGYILRANKDDQKHALVSYLGYRQPDDFEFIPGSQHTRLNIAVRKLHEFNAGSKYFIEPRIHRIWSDKLPAYEERKQDYYFRHPFEVKDTTIMVLPKDFVVDVLPKEKALQCDYGYYKTTSWFNQAEHALYTATTLTLKKHKVLARDYAAVKSFFDDVVQDNAQRLVIKGTPGSPEKKAF